METAEIIELIKNAEKSTPVKVYIKEKTAVVFPRCTEFTMGAEGGVRHKLVFGEWKDIEPVLKGNQENLMEVIVEDGCRNSAVPLIDKKTLHARIEPGAIIRDKAEIGENAIVMMGAIINIGSEIGEGTMIDMGAVVGANARIGKYCHIGAGAVLAGVLEPPGARPVEIGDNVLVGANAVILEGCRIGSGAVVGAGAVVTTDVSENTVVVGNPAGKIKNRDQVGKEKIETVSCLRNLRP